MEEKGEENAVRGQWKNKTEYLLSCLGYAVGVGNVWRFPYLCYRSGGGAFLVPYLLMLFTCGLPLFFMESALGQFTSRGFFTIFEMSPLFKGTGAAILIINFIVSCYFNTIVSYTLYFMMYCLRSELPWASCDNAWNTEACHKLNSKNEKLFNSTLKAKTPADEFFHNNILEISNGIEETGGIVWPIFVCNIITWILTYLCIIKGVKSVGKVVYFTSTFPYVVLTILLIRGLTLPGALNGISFYILPQWDQLLNLKVWADAAIQIFFSLGPGWGGLVNVASYNKFKNDNQLDAILIPIMNCGTSIFAGFVVFSVIGYMAHETNLPIATAATGGPALAFVTYPEAIALMPFANFWGFIFFFMLFLLGLGSMFVQVEAVSSSICDLSETLRRWKSTVTLLISISMALVSTMFTTNSGMYWLQLFDWYSASISLILICLVEVIMVAWTYGLDNFVKDIEFMIERNVNYYWIISWKFSTPLILSFIFVTTIFFNTRITYKGHEYPEWAITVGWMSCILSMICIPVYMGYRLLYLEQGDIFERLSSSIRPRKEWGPAAEKDLTEWRSHVHFQRLKRRGTLDTYHKQFLELTSTD